MIDAILFNASRILYPLSERISGLNGLNQMQSSLKSVAAFGLLENVDTQTVPFICRLAAFLLLLPFVLCIGLDVIAYAIARTLRLSMLQARVPGSPSGSASTHQTDGALGFTSSNSVESDSKSSEKAFEDSLGLYTTEASGPSTNSFDILDGSGVGTQQSDTERDHRSIPSAPLERRNSIDGESR